MARPRKDPKLKALRGTLRKDREPKALSVAGATSPAAMVAPVPLTPRAIAHFDVIAGMLAAEGRAGPQFAYTVAILAQRLDQGEQLATTIAGEGSTYTTTSKDGDTLYKANPAVAMLADALRHQQALLSELMLSPTAHQRIARPDKPKRNSFADL